MFPLWRKLRKLKLYCKRPSPTHGTAVSGSAQGPGTLAKFGSCIEGTSLSAFFSGVLSKRLSAGITVEAAVALPLFLFFFLNLGCAIEMIRLHGNLAMALRETGNKMSLYGYALKWEEKEEEGGGLLKEEALDFAFSYTYVKGQIVKYAGEDYLNQSPLVYGADGLQFWESEIFTTEDTFELVLTYGVAPWMQVPAVNPFRMANVYYGHIWNGYEIALSYESENGTDTVYVAKTGSVYHESRDCSHLSLAIWAVNSGQVPYERNGDGERYTPCEKCGNGAMPTKVFISLEGNRFHLSAACSGLKRTVYSMDRGEAQEKYRPCSRCAGSG